MASLYPAQAVGLENGGTLAPGRSANIVWLDDDLKSRGTWIDGTRLV